LDFFEHGETEVFETVCPVIFSLISLMKDQVPSLNEKGVQAVVLGPESSDTEIKDAFKGKYNLLFTKSLRCQVGFEYRSRISSSFLDFKENKNGNVQYYFEV